MEDICDCDFCIDGNPTNWKCGYVDRIKEERDKYRAALEKIDSLGSFSNTVHRKTELERILYEVLYDTNT
jgi:hypothetical protein